MPPNAIAIEHVAPSALTPAPYNPRRMDDAQRARLERGMREFGLVDPIIARRSDGMVIGGHQRLTSAINLGLASVPVVYLDDIDDNRAAALNVLLNNPAAQGQWDMPKLSDILSELDGNGFDATLTGFDDEELQRILSWTPDGASERGTGPSMAERFGVPPFSVLDARQGYWQERKRAWLALGIESELGRGGNNLNGSSAGIASGSGEALPLRLDIKQQKPNAAPGGALRDATRLNKDGKTQRGDGRGRAIPGGGTGRNSAWLFRTDNGYEAVEKREGVNGGWSAHPRYYEQKGAAERRLGRSLSTEEFEREHFVPPASEIASGTSIFDPVLCELAYRWFCPPGGHVFDPFAGGSVRGILASKLGRAYTGIELRPEQIAANEQQAARILPPELPPPKWLAGDSRNAAALAPGAYDFLFSCPPYADLERYSDDERDLSTMSYADFLAAYRAIIAQSVALLAPNRFACFVVGEVRGAERDTCYRGFVPDTVRAFEDAGARFYNEAILITSVGSLPIRAGKQFQNSRKLGKTHQNVLVFVKGEPKATVAACGPVEVTLPDEEAVRPSNG